MPLIIETNPKILGGQPVVKGTRVPIARVLALIGMNYNLTDLKKEIPGLSKLTKKDILSILYYHQSRLNYQ